MINQNRQFLSVQNLGVTLGKKQVLNSVSFEINKQEIVCILGNNGAGKSTLLRCCAGLGIFKIGRIYVRGYDISCIDNVQRIRLLAWGAQNLYPSYGFTALEFVSLADEWKRFMRGASGLSCIENDFYLSCLKDFDAEHLAKININVLSGGEWKRVQLARVWAQRAKLVVLDEPSTGLDLKHVSLFRIKCEQYIDKYHGSILFSTHDISLALSLATRIIVLDGGDVVIDAPTTRAIENPLFNKVFDVDFKWEKDKNNIVRATPLL